MGPRIRTVPQHNYEVKLLELHRTGVLPSWIGYHRVSVAHDDWCGFLAGGRCDCDPDIELKWSQSAATQN
jgi:hypothetical protein